MPRRKEAFPLLADADRIRGTGRRWRNLSRTYRRLVLLARTLDKSPDATAAKSEGSGYRPNRIIGILIGLRAGNILAAIAWRFVAVASKRANVGRTLTLRVIPPQLREAADV